MTAHAELKTLNEEEPIIARQIAAMKDDVPYEIGRWMTLTRSSRHVGGRIRRDHVERRGQVEGRANIARAGRSDHWTTDARMDSYANGFATAQWKPT
jgi:hypothetical protein